MNLDRYSRQILFSPIQKKGQEKLSQSSALVVGVGALGTVISNHLVRAGIGKLRIVDRDYVELSNLQRQILFDEEDVKESLPKAIAAKRKLKKINPHVKIDSMVDHVSSKNISQITDNVDIVLDGTDNFSTRFLLNDICFKKGIPFSYGGVVASRGMNAFLIPGETPCLRCLINKGSSSGQTCDTVGVIGPVVDIVSSLQVTDALKYLTGNKESISRTLRTYDIWYNYHYEVKFTDPSNTCPTCSEKIYPSLHHTSEEETVLCGRNTVQIHEKSKLDLQSLEDRLRKVANVTRTPFLLKAVISNDSTFVIFQDGRVLVQGTEDTIAARTLYDRYIGS